MSLIRLSFTPLRLQPIQLAHSKHRFTHRIRCISFKSDMEAVKNAAERLAGLAANGYHQSDVSDLRGKVSTSNLPTDVPLSSDLHDCRPLSSQVEQAASALKLQRPSRYATLEYFSYHGKMRTQRKPFPRSKSCPPLPTSRSFSVILETYQW